MAVFKVEDSTFVLRILCLVFAVLDAVFTGILRLVHPEDLLIVSWRETRMVSPSDSVRAPGVLYSVAKIVVPVRALVVKLF